MAGSKSKPTPKPWEMQDGEPVVAFRFFAFYRDMQRRSVNMAAKAFGQKSPRRLEKLSAKHDWVNRARAWDVEIDRRVREAQVGELADMRKRHINLGVGMQTAAVKELQALVAKIEKASKAALLLDPKGHHEPLLTVSDLIRLSQHGTQLERLSRGEPTDHSVVETSEATGLAALSTADLKALKALKAKLQGDV